MSQTSGSPSRRAMGQRHARADLLPNCCAAPVATPISIRGPIDGYTGLCERHNLGGGTGPDCVAPREDFGCGAWHSADSIPQSAAHISQLGFAVIISASYMLAKPSLATG